MDTTESGLQIGLCIREITPIHSAWSESWPPNEKVRGARGEHPGSHTSWKTATIIIAVSPQKK